MRYLLLWLLGIPIPVIILLALIFWRPFLASINHYQWRSINRQSGN